MTYDIVEAIFWMCAGAFLSTMPVVLWMTRTHRRGKRTLTEYAATVDPETLRRVSSELSNLTGQLRTLAEEQERAARAACEPVPANA